MLLDDEASNIEYVAAFVKLLERQLRALGEDPTPEALIAAYNVGPTQEVKHGKIGRGYVRDVYRFMQTAQAYLGPQDPARGPR